VTSVRSYEVVHVRRWESKKPIINRRVGHRHRGTHETECNRTERSEFYFQTWTKSYYYSNLPYVTWLIPGTNHTVASPQRTHARTKCSYIT